LIIGIQKDLKTIKEALQSRGYDVKYIDLNQNKYVDIYIYANNQVTGVIEQLNNSVTEENYKQHSSNCYGTLMINAMNKSVDKVEHIIKNRTYSNLNLI